MEFAKNENAGRKYPVQELEDEPGESVETLEAAGFQRQECTVMHDRSGVAYFFVKKKDGSGSWFPLRYD